MKFKRIFYIVFLIIFTFSIQSCNTVEIEDAEEIAIIEEIEIIEGIDEPVTIDGNTILISSAILRNELTLGSQTHRPSSSTDILLYIRLDVSINSFENFMEQNWTIFVIDDTGRQETPSVTSFLSGNFGGENKNFLELVFAVSKKAESFCQAPIFSTNRKWKN